MSGRGIGEAAVFSHRPNSRMTLPTWLEADYAHRTSGVRGS